MKLILTLIYQPHQKNRLLALKFFLIFAFISTLTSNGQVVVKSVAFGGSSYGSAFPIAPITIEADVSANEKPDLSIIFRFCDENWRPYENFFLENTGFNKDHEIWLTNLPVSVSGASYHFSKSFPNKNVTFPFPGKWMYFIVDRFDEAKIYYSGGFFVTANEVRLITAVKKETLIGSTALQNTEGRSQKLTIDFELPDELFYNKVSHIEVVENRKIYSPIKLDTEEFDNLRYYEFDGYKGFSFVVRDLYPGNNYRQTDLRNSKRFIEPDVKAQIDMYETSRYFRPGKRDMNGSFKLMNDQNPEADYLNVEFTLSPDIDPGDRVFIAGSFTDWLVLPEFELFKEQGIYKRVIELKRGIYDYQYVVLTSGFLDWYYLEGNFWETENSYSIFLYYNSDENGGYKKMIGYKNIAGANAKD
ncbi:MAG: DUF5103 domain-containing protein [Melioribacteraceae bacterium]|nr:DUF5103 domain-containing protein [Melioribacteraceae bacterium]MCF8264359.1 DUF5103 domain-containing protein [Melioribacteraceae bacterium]MCF8413416.1 DUF5103 domain-containing protein [Melioribacteraceae bacterium]